MNGGSFHNNSKEKYATGFGVIPVTDSYWLWAPRQVTYSLSFPTAKADVKNCPTEKWVQSLNLECSNRMATKDSAFLSVKWGLLHYPSGTVMMGFK